MNDDTTPPQASPSHMTCCFSHCGGRRRVSPAQLETSNQNVSSLVQVRPGRYLWVWMEGAVGCGLNSQWNREDYKEPWIQEDIRSSDILSNSTDTLPNSSTYNKVNNVRRNVLLRNHTFPLPSSPTQSVGSGRPLSTDSRLIHQGMKLYDQGAEDDERGVIGDEPGVISDEHGVIIDERGVGNHEPGVKHVSGDSKDYKKAARRVSTPGKRIQQVVYSGVRPLSKMSHRTGGEGGDMMDKPTRKSRETDRLRNSSQLHSLQQGIPDKSIFMFHGVGGCSKVWEAQVLYLSRTYPNWRIIVPDLLGHGNSHAPSDPKHYLFSHLMADMTSLFDLYKGKSNLLIGHSYGTSFATVLSRERSNLISHLILVSGGGPLPLSPQPGIFSLPKSLFYCFLPTVRCIFMRAAFSTKEHQKHDNNNDDEDIAFTVPAHVLHSIMRGQHWSGGDVAYHSSLYIPTLLIYGARDKFVSIDEEMDMLSAIPECKLEVLEDASHMVMMEKPDDVNYLISAFIESNREWEVGGRSGESY